MPEVYKYRTQHLRGTSEEWQTWENKDPERNKPLEGEIIIELDNTNQENPLHKLKIGDGVTPYSQLAYLQAGDEIVSQVLPKVVTVILNKTNWQPDAKHDGWYYQDVMFDNITLKSRLDLQPTIDQITTFKQLKLSFQTENLNTPENNNNTIRVYSTGDIPAIDIETQASIVETNMQNDNDVVAGIPLITSSSVDNEYNAKSSNAQSGYAVAEAISQAVFNAVDLVIDSEYDPQSGNAQSGRGLSAVMAGQKTNEGGEIFNDNINNIAGIKGYRISNIESGNATNGVYVRLRNNREIAVVYTLTIKSKDIQTLLGNTMPIENLIITSENSVLITYDTSAIATDNEVTIKVNLAAHGGYAQLNHKITDLIGGAGSVKVTIGEDANINNYYTANFYIQLTTDTSNKDIVPKDDSIDAPNTDAISFRLFGYNSQYVMYTNKVDSGAGAKYYTNRINNANYYTDVTNGMTVIFPEDADNKVQIRCQRQDFINAGVASIYTSNQKSVDIADPYTHIIYLNDANLTDKAYNHYAVNDVVNIDNVSHYYSVFKIEQIKQSSTDATILVIKKIDQSKITERMGLDDEGSNWLYIIGKSYGEVVEQALYAHAEGTKNIAVGLGSHAEGTDNRAIGNHAHAEGRQTVANYAAHAEGRETQAIGMTSHAEGHKTIASNKHAHAEGLNTRSKGQAAHAEGYSVEAIGDNSHAEGNLTYAEGLNSHTEGQSTHAVGVNSHAQGYMSSANADYAHAEGYKGTANGEASHSEGYETTTTIDASYSHVEGKGTITESRAAHAEGDGSKAIGIAAHAEGGGTEATGNYSHAEGYKSKAIGVSSHAEGDNNEAVGDYSHTEGQFTQALSNYAHSEGYNTISNGPASHAEGFGKIVYNADNTIDTDKSTGAFGSYSHVEGFQTKTTAKNAHAEGYNTTAGGEGSHAEGETTIAAGDYSHAEGSGTKAQGYASHAGGNATIANYDYQTVIGQFNDNQKDALFEVGNGSSDTNRSNAFVVKNDTDGLAYAEVQKTGNTNHSVVTTGGFETELKKYIDCGAKLPDPSIGPKIFILY